MRSIFACVALVVLCSAFVSAQTLPTFPANWYATEVLTIVDANGTTTRNGVSSYQLDGATNLTSWVGDGQSFVADWTNQVMWFLTDAESLNCDYYCLMSGISSACASSQTQGDALCTSDMLTGSKYEGSTVVEGQNCDEFYWPDMLGTTPMGWHVLFNVVSEPVPVVLFAYDAPFGTWNSNVTWVWKDFNAGSVPAANFQINNQATCYAGTALQCNAYGAETKQVLRKHRMVMEN